jgi:hypothetical protein
MTPDIDVAAIQERCDAATEGPWEWAPDMVQLYTTEDAPVDEYDADIRSVDSFHGVMLCVDPNREFIAHARTDVPALIDHIESLDSALAASGAEVERLQVIISRVAKLVTEWADKRRQIHYAKAEDDPAYTLAGQIALVLVRKPDSALTPPTDDRSEDGE